MNIKLRSNYLDNPEKAVILEAEEIAGQMVGSRLQFHASHDLTFQMADGAVMIDDIEMVIYIMPNQFFCYRGDDVIATVILENTHFEVDLREPVNGINGRAFLRAVK